MKYNQSYNLKLIEVFFLLLVIIGLSQYSGFVSGLQVQVLADTGLLQISIVVLVVLSAVLAFIWHLFDKKVNLHELFQTIFIFYVAHQITTYGVSKIMQTQFLIPDYILERPVGELNGYWITWVYFGYSSAFTAILGAIQILGSVLLIFRKTRLLATFILLPVMINVCFIEYFYSISPLAFFNSLHYTFVLIFLLLQHSDKLIHLLFSYKEYFYFNKKTILLNLARLMVIVGAVVQAYWFKRIVYSQTSLKGVWQVDEIIIRNQQGVLPAVNRDEGWSKVYFEWNNKCLFKHSADRFDDRTDLHGQYEVDEKRHLTRIVFKSGRRTDSLRLDYKIDGNRMIMSGTYQNAPLQMRLTRLK